MKPQCQRCYEQLVPLTHEAMKDQETHQLRHQIWAEGIERRITKFVPGIHLARRCWRPTPPGATVLRETPTRSTPDCRADHRWHARRPVGLQDCGRRGCTGSSWTGHSACHFHSASAAAAEHDGRWHAGKSSPACRTLKGAENLWVVCHHKSFSVWPPATYAGRNFLFTNLWSENVRSHKSQSERSVLEAHLRRLYPALVDKFRPENFVIYTNHCVLWALAVSQALETDIIYYQPW